ncbi:MAG: hypothetical protein ABR580_13355, partial [Halomonas sp.]
MILHLPLEQRDPCGEPLVQVREDLAIDRDAGAFHGREHGRQGQLDPLEQLALRTVIEHRAEVVGELPRRRHGQPALVGRLHVVDVE